MPTTPPSVPSGALKAGYLSQGQMAVYVALFEDSLRMYLSENVSGVVDRLRVI
jgi:hypothetical protein